MLMRMIIAAAFVMLDYVYAVECNMRLLDSYADTLEHKIWVECIREKDITDRLDFMYGLSETSTEKGFLLVGDYEKCPAFQSFVSLCKKISDDSDDKVKRSVTALFRATANKYFETVRRVERAKDCGRSVHSEISADKVITFLRADKTRPVMTF